MKIIYIIFFIIILLFLQIGILPHLKILGVFPNLIIISILSLSILKEWKKNFVWIIIAGLFLDVYSLNNIIGVSIISLLGAGILVYFLNQNTFKKANILSLIITFLIGILAFYILSLILSLIFSFSFTFSIVLILYNLILSLPIFWIMKKAIIIKWLCGLFVYLSFINFSGYLTTQRIKAPNNQYPITITPKKQIPIQRAIRDIPIKRKQVLFSILSSICEII